MAQTEPEPYGPDYFERGRQLGISWYERYRWMRERSLGEARAFLGAMGAAPPVSVTDFGCAKGFFVRALLSLGCEARGVDVSRYALGEATLGCGGRLWHPEDLNGPGPTDLGFCKDTLEHCATAEDLALALDRMRRLARRWLVVVPLADAGFYRIAEYEEDVTHAIREGEAFWLSVLGLSGFEVTAWAHRVPGLKDHWYAAHPKGNGFFFATSTKGAGGW